MSFDREMQRALEADGEKLRQLTGDNHGPAFIPERPEDSYLRGVLANNIERANDIIWDLQNKPEFNKRDPNVLGVIVVAEQMLVSLTALLFDCDNSAAVPRMREALIEARTEVTEIRKNICEVHDLGAFGMSHPKFDTHAKREIARLDAMLSRIDAALSDASERGEK